MEFRVLGPLQVAVDGHAVPISSPRQRALLSLLLAHAGHPVSSDAILDEVWGDEPPDSGREAVVFHVGRLRRTLGGDGHGPIETRGGGYALAVEPEAIDAVRFERLAGEGHANLAVDPAAASERLTAALALWRGEPYEGLGDLPFAVAEIRRLAELRLRAIEDRAEAELALGRANELVAELTTLVDREPLREHLRALLIVALYRCGRQADALRVYGDGRRVLAEELGIDPGPELAALETAILRQDPALLAGPLPGVGVGSTGGVAAPLRNPYKGLRPFDEADAADFFGREALTARLVARLGEVARTGGLLAVVGPSGSGKSSVVRAGLVPALRTGGLPGSDRWPIAVLFPGARPFEELAAALRSVAADPATVPTAAELAADPDALAATIERLVPPDGRLVLVVDQVEELWTLATETRDAFVEVLVRGLAGSAGRLLVIVTLRADHVDAALRSPALGRLLRDGTELVPPLQRDELERAIERPAVGAGLVLEPGLVDRIVADVAERPAMLPLLQYALTELAERAVSGSLERAAYDAIGGVLGALAGRAEATWDGLGSVEREAVRQVFLRLVVVEQTGEASARRIARSAFDDSAVEAAIIERFGRARLLAHGRDARSGEPTVEIAHEALLTRWPRLAAWIEGERESIWMRRRLGEATDEWLEHDRDDGFLLSGGRLEMFASWTATTDLHLRTDERAFLGASLESRDREAAAEAAHLAEERRLERRGTRWLRALVGVFALAAVLSTTLLVLVWRQSEAAAEERALATARELAVASTGRLELQPDLAALLAIESARATLDRGWIAEEALEALHWSIQAARIPYPREDVPTAVRVGPDGPRGVYLIPADELVALAATGAGRSLTDDECATYLHIVPCPTPVDPSGAEDADVGTDGGRVAMAALADTGGAAEVRLLSQLPVDTAGLLAAHATSSGTTIRSVAGDGGDDGPLEALEGVDLAILARPGDVADLARADRLIDLRDLLALTETADLGASSLADLGWVGPLGTGAQSRDARLVGAPVAVTASSVLWYPAEAFAAAGYAPPTTWTEVDALTDGLVEDGETPWCPGLAGGSAAVDLWEDLLVGHWGPREGDAEVHVTRRLGRPVVTSTLHRYRELVTAPGAIRGGLGSALVTPPAWAAAQMGTSATPRCWLVHDGADTRPRWLEPVRPDIVPIPLELGEAQGIRGRVYTLVVLRDRPEVRALVRYLLGPQAARALAADDTEIGVLPVLAVVEPAAERATAGSLQAALAEAIGEGRFWADLSDQLPRAVALGTLSDGLARLAEADAGSVDQVVDDIQRDLMGASGMWTP